MLSCYWVQPAQLHPWFKPTTLKRKSPSMSLHSRSPSPADEDDLPDSRVKRPRRTTLTLDHMRPQKRKLPSFPQSSAEDEEDLADARSLTTKRQRCTSALEHGIERLSLIPPSLPVPAPEFTTHLPAPGPAAASVPPDLRFSQWLDIPAVAAASPLPPALNPGFQQISPPTIPDTLPVFTTTAAPVLPAPTASACFADAADAIEDVKMRSSSWYEPEKDRACNLLITLHVFLCLSPTR